MTHGTKGDTMKTPRSFCANTARAALLAAALFTTGVSLAAAPVPGDSVYQLQVTLTDQNGHAEPWAARRGTPQIVSMFYTHCAYVCPMIVETMNQVAKALPPQAQGRLGLLLISIDPQRDTVARLHEVSGERHLASPPWTLARSDAAAVREIAAVLGVQYRRLPDGEFNHSTVLTLLSADGRILAQSEQLGEPDPAFVDAVRRALAAP